VRGSRKQREEDLAARLQQAEGAADEVSQQEAKVTRQLGLVERLTEGWRRVHQTNHLAQLFRDEGHLG
jgi:hypothetical protein